MGSEVGTNGMTPEQQAGLAAGAVLAIAGIAFSVIRRRRTQESPVKTTADRIVENPSLQNLFTSARQSLEEAKGRVDPKTIEAAKKELTRQYEAGAEAWHSDFEPTARELANRALEVAQRVRTEGTERSRDLSKRWEKEYGPAARSIAEEAVTEADEIISMARKRASEVSDVARNEYLPKLAPMAVAAGGAIASALSQGSERIQKQVKDGQKADVSLPKGLTRRMPQRKSPNALQRAGQGAMNVTGQIIMIGFWAAALGAVVYFGLLNEERREQVRAFFNDTVEQMSELIEDFRDEEAFTDGADSVERF